MDSIELFFRSVGKKDATHLKEHGAVRAYARFSHNPSAVDAEAALRHAWKTLRYLQPQIAAYLQGNRLHYKVPQATDIESWMIETFRVETVLTVDQLLSLPRRLLLPALHYFPKSSEILFCASHWRIDAIGATSVINLLFKSLAEPSTISFGDEGKNLSPGRDEAAAFTQDVSKEADDAATSLLMEYTTNLPSLGLPVQLVNEFSGTSSRIENKLPSAATKSIVAACKREDISVTAAVHAALVVALQDLTSDPSAAERYTSWGAFDYRPHAAPEHTDPAAHPVTVMMCSLPISFTTTDFYENVSSFETFYQQLQNPFNNAALHATLVPFTLKCAEMVNRPLPRGMPQPTEPLVANVGTLNRYLDGRYGDGVVEITDFWLGGMVVTRQPLLYLWVWRGRLTLSMCYNDQFYTAGFMRSFVDKVVRVLVDELGIEHA